MTKTPPHRRGITFEVGAPLEARDSLKNWYAATIEKIDYEDEKVLIHYRQWSHRYDEWFDWSSPYLRPVERIQLRRRGLQEHGTAPGFQINQKVLACWSDCRYYPAKILSRNKDDSYTVKFFDGVVKSVKGIKIKPFRKEGSNNKGRSQGRKRGPPSKVWKIKENGTGRGVSGHHSDHDDSEEEEEEEEEAAAARVEQDPAGLWEGAGESEVEKANGVAGQGEGQPEKGEGPPEKGEGPPGGDRKVMGLENGREEPAEADGKEVEEERAALPNGSHESSVEKQEKDESSEASSGSAKRTRGKPAEGRDAERPTVPELRKRRSSTGQTPPSKRNRANSSSDRNGRSQISSARSDCAPGSLDDKDGPSQPDHPEDPKPTEQTGPTSDLATLLQRQVHLPTTNKYSREPLYRVIKNQPPPILSIELDHNPFKCQVPGCPKSFRKASLLHYHMKYYHSESDLTPPQGLQAHGPDQQETPRRRRAASASLDTPSPLSDSKSGHTPSPPTANGVHRQRSSSHCERSKENQHANRSLHDDRDWVTMETEREKRREQRPRDFFCLKTKKKKKKKRKSKSDSHSSEKSNGFSPSPCNLALSLKLPLSPKHCSYASHCPEQELDDGEDSGSDWSTDSPLWSEEESEAGLDLNMPLNTAHSEHGVETVARGSEIVRCVCEVQEENDFMIQCDECSCWQHGTCMGLYEDSVPDTYTCYICRDPPAQRQSQRYWYDKDWLSSGHMYGLSFLEENYSQQNSRKMATTHQLLGDVHRVFEVLNGLQLKMSILQTQAHPDLKLWRQPWRPTDGVRRKGGGDLGSGTSTPTPSPCSPLEAESMSSETGKVVAPTPPAIYCPTSYISSEHCYQKPRTYYPALERRLVVETRGGSELEHSLRSSEDLLELAEHRYGAPLERCKAERRELECCKKLLAAPERDKGTVAEVKEEEPDPATCEAKPDPDLLMHQQWQLNLLEHIEAVQDEVSHRMDLIEKELDVLESWLDYTGELEPPDPLARLPQLKLRIRQLLTDLGTVQQIALCSSTT